MTNSADFIEVNREVSFVNVVFNALVWGDSAVILQIV